MKAFVSEYKLTNKCTIYDSVLQQGWKNSVHCPVLWYMVQNHVTTVNSNAASKTTIEENVSKGSRQCRPEQAQRVPGG